MKFYRINEQIEAQLKEILSNIRLSMNGVIADSMREKGIVYKQNYGVALTDLRKLAATIAPSQELAQRLWIEGWRETYILSVFLQPIENFTATLAIERIKSAPQKEIIDVLCLYLLSKTEFATNLCVDLVNSENENCQITGFMLASRVYSQLSDIQIQQIIKKSVLLSETENYNIYKSVGICLGRLCRTSQENASKITDIMGNFCVSKIPSQCAIADELKQELDFLINL